jgi:hypothetical protein
MEKLKMLTRKDFIKKANELIKDYKGTINKYPDAKKIADKGLEVLVAEYSRIAEQSNPRFDKGRFNDWIAKGVE